MSLEPWQKALQAWLDAGQPSGPSVEAYRQWTHERFGLDRHRQLHLQEKWALDDLSWGAAQPPVEAVAAERGFPLQKTGTYATADGAVRAELQRVAGPGGALLHPRAQLTQPQQPALNRLLAASNALRLKAMLDHVLDGRVYQHTPLPGEAQQDPTAWLLDPRPAEAPELFKIWPVGSQAIESGPRRALLLALELQVQANLTPWDGKATPKAGRFGQHPTDPPPWVGLVRERHVRLLALLRGDRLINTD